MSGCMFVGAREEGRRGGAMRRRIYARGKLSKVNSTELLL